MPDSKAKQIKIGYWLSSILQVGYNGSVVRVQINTPLPVGRSPMSETLRLICERIRLGANRVSVNPQAAAGGPCKAVLNYAFSDLIRLNQRFRSFTTCIALRNAEISSLARALPTPPCVRFTSYDPCSSTSKNRRRTALKCCSPLVRRKNGNTAYIGYEVHDDDEQQAQTQNVANQLTRQNGLATVVHDRRMFVWVFIRKSGKGSLHSSGLTQD